MGGKIEHNWKVQKWTKQGGIERTFAECDDLAIAFAAYDAAVNKYPADHITLRAGAQIMRQHGAPPKVDLVPRSPRV